MIISEKSSGMHFIRFPKQLLRKNQCCVCVISFMFCIVEFQQNLVKPHHFQSQKAFVHQAGNEGQIEKSRRSGSLAWAFGTGSLAEGS